MRLLEEPFADEQGEKSIVALCPGIKGLVYFHQVGLDQGLLPDALIYQTSTLCYVLTMI